jgi:hypothetical protein
VVDTNMVLLIDIERLLGSEELALLDRTVG